MKSKAAISRTSELMNQIGRRTRPFWNALTQDTGPTSARDGSLDRFVAKDRGEWYLHTVLGR